METKGVSNKINNISLDKVMISAIIGLGIVFSLVQFVYNRSLWLDESSLAINIISRDALGLLKPLSRNQVAPILFLQMEKMFSLIIPNSEYGLRVFPMLCYWGSLLFFYLVLKLLFENNAVIIVGISLIVFNPSLIYYSNEVKQYMTDVLITISTYYFLLKNYNKFQNRYIILTILGVFAILLSNIAPIILFSSGIYLIMKFTYKDLKQLRFIIPLFLIWSLTFLFYYQFFISDHPTRKVMISYWQYWGAFMPSNPLSPEFGEFLFDKAQMIAYKLFKFGNMGGILFGLLSLAGVVAIIYRKKWDMAILIFMPIIIHLILSSFEMYPFDRRLILYLSPIYIILVLSGLQYITILTPSFFQSRNFNPLIILIPIIIFLVVKKKGFPYQVEEIKKSMNFINENLKEEEKLLLYYAAKPAFSYYKKTNYNIPVIEPHLLGSWEERISSQDIEYLKSVRGKYWLLISHPRNDEISYITNYVDSLDHKKLKEFNAFGSSAYLFNSLE